MKCTSCNPCSGITKGSPAGICVLINHGGSYGGYAHFNDTVVSKGQRVIKGQLIGHAGSTGATTGPHLHFEIRDFGRLVNPLEFLAH